MIKPEFWEDDKIGECSPTARLLFIALWNFADDEGYLEYRPKWIKARIFPYDSFEIEPLIDELLTKGRLELRGDILSIVHFLDHQKIERPRTSELSQTFQNSPTPHRIITDTSPPKREVKLREVKLKEEKQNGDESPTPSQTMKDFIQMILDKSENYSLFVSSLSERRGTEIEIVRAELDKFISYWTEKTKDGRKQRWETEKVFEVQRRLSTWLSKANEFDRTKPKPKVFSFVS